MTKSLPQDTAQWNTESVRSFLEQTGDGSAPTFQNIFQWSRAQYEQACETAVAQLARQGVTANPPVRIGGGKALLEKKVLAETAMIARRPELFEPDHLTGKAPKPTWYPDGLLLRDRQGRPDGQYRFATATFAFLAHARASARSGLRKAEKADAEELKRMAASRGRPRSVQRDLRRSSARVESGEQSDHSTASTTASLRHRVKRAKLSTPSDDEDLVMMEAPSRPHLPKPPRSDVCIYVVRVTEDAVDLVLEVFGAYRWDDCTRENQRDLDMDKLCANFKPRKAERFYWFNESVLLPARSAMELNGAIQTLYTCMDTSKGRGSVMVFLSDDERRVAHIPAPLRGELPIASNQGVRTFF